MAASPKMLMEKEGPLGWIIFNQPEKRNAVSQEMWAMVPDMVRDLEAADDIRVIILRGAGDQAFVAGADISQFKDRRRNMDDELEYRRISGRGSQSLANIQKPLLAMIQGYCVGGGVGIALTCDLRIASDDARFGIPAARLGLGYHYDGIEKLMHLIGPSNVLDIFFSARTDFSAVEALGMGLVNHVVPQAEVESFIRRYALRIAGSAPLTQRTAKADARELLQPLRNAIWPNLTRC
jgi:enoyl-CoA hydratase